MHIRLLLSSLLILSALIGAGPVAAESLDYDVRFGHFYKQANGHGGAGSTGYMVLDEPQVPFWSQMRELGGVDTLGYPIGRRFFWEGFTVQPFQKAVLQWRPEQNRAVFVNIFDRLSAAGHDAWLDSVRSIPPSFDHSADAGLPWEQVVTRHLAILDANPALKARYLADADPIQHYGLPMGAKDYGNVYVVRAQRAALQQWKVDTPWARAGQVVVANGGDIAKELGVYPVEAATPRLPAHDNVVIAVGPGMPGRLYALHVYADDTAEGPSAARYALVVSDDIGATWRPFAGGLPASDLCGLSMTMDYAALDALYVGGCDGTYRWTGGTWTKLGGDVHVLAVVYGNPSDLWGRRPTGQLVHSVDGGATWENAGLLADGPIQAVALEVQSPNRILAISVHRGWWYGVWRGTGRPGEWTQIPVSPQPAVGIAGVTLDGSTGQLLLVRSAPEPPQVDQLWRSVDIGALNPASVGWQLVQDFGDYVDVHLLAAGSGSTGQVLYATRTIRPPEGVWIGDAPVLVRSTDGGQSWQALAQP